MRAVVGSMCYHHATGSFFLWGAIASYVAAYFGNTTHSFVFYLLFVPLRGMTQTLSRPYRHTLEDSLGPKA